MIHRQFTGRSTPPKKNGVEVKRAGILPFWMRISPGVRFFFDVFFAMASPPMPPITLMGPGPSLASASPPCSAASAAAACVRKKQGMESQDALQVRLKGRA